MKVLYAGPFLGEFGWEIMGWVGGVRKRAKDFDHVIVGCRDQSKVLYQDFCNEYVVYDYYQDCCGQGVALPNEAVTGIEMHLPSIVEPKPDWECTALGPTLFRPAEQEYIEYVNNGLPRDKDVVMLHCRNRPKLSWDGTSDQRNYSAEKMGWLAEQLISHGRKPISIGHPEASLHVKGTIDRRGMPLDSLVELMCISGCLIGPCSGPTHLATLCGLPHVAWCDPNGRAQGHTTAERLKTAWNPFDTPVKVIENMDPQSHEVMAAYMELCS